jgi:oxaloacetate decarboxylase alpha subunit
VDVGAEVHKGDIVLILEAMKMETEVRAASAGVVSAIHVKQGDSVQSGQPVLTLG